MINPLREADLGREAEDDALSAALSGTLSAGTAYEVIQGLLDVLCTHEGWAAAAYWTAEADSPRRVSLFATSGAPTPARPPASPQPSRAVREAFTTKELVMDPITDALLALPLVHQNRVIGVVASGGPPPVVTRRRAEVLRGLASHCAAALSRRAATDTLSAQVASLQRDLGVLTVVVRAGQEGRPPRRVALENAYLDEVGRHVVELLSRLNGQPIEISSAVRRS
jgi:hypothetical protein